MHRRENEEKKNVEIDIFIQLIYTQMCMLRHMQQGYNKPCIHK